ncbi:MAG: alpha/beta fold hydrolase [Burkholderiales bacterium]
MYSLAIHRNLTVGDTHLHTAEAGAGPALVFFHGLGWSHALWAGAFDRYADRYRVIAGDTRGHGDSGKPPGPYSIAQFAEDWTRALESMNVRDAILIGFSQGGMIAQQMAVSAPDHFMGLFLACTSCAANAAGFANMEARIKAMQSEGPEAAARVALGSVFSEAYQAAHPAQTEQFIRWRAAADQPSLVAAMLATKGYDVRAGLATLRMPTRIVCAGADSLTPPARVAAVAQGLGVPMHTIAGSGHMVQIERPVQFYSELDTFLNTIGT